MNHIAHHQVQRPVVSHSNTTRLLDQKYHGTSLIQAVSASRRTIGNFSNMYLHANAGFVWLPNSETASRKDGVSWDYICFADADFPKFSLITSHHTPRTYEPSIVGAVDGDRERRDQADLSSTIICQTPSVVCEAGLLRRTIQAIHVLTNQVFHGHHTAFCDRLL